MGLFRKALSVGTAGAVDFRSDKERTAAYTRATRNAVRAQGKAQKKHYKREARAMGYVPPSAPVGPTTAPPGWYPDTARGTGLRWWDGVQWTDHTSG